MRRHFFSAEATRLGWALTLLMVPGFSISGWAQIPSEFKNLQVLPSDIEQRQLIQVMRGFAGSLGVRCQHCHVGENPRDFSTFDFASDDKEPKKVARVMLKMVQRVNQEFLPATGRAEARRLEVNCFTCHRGVTRPQTLQQALLDPILEAGADAGIQRYRLLRKKYYGRAVFDFGERTLIELAETLARDQKPQEAVEMLKLNLEFHPESPSTYAALGNILAATGDRAGAIENLEKALQLEPDSRWIKRRLDAIRSQGQE